MSKKSVSRRSFMAAAGAAQAAAAAPRTPVVVQPFPQVEMRAQQEPIRIVTMYQFEPFEVEKITKAPGGTKVEIVMCSTREEFRSKLKDAEVVYGDMRGADLDYAAIGTVLFALAEGGAGARDRT